MTHEKTSIAKDISDHPVFTHNWIPNMYCHTYFVVAPRHQTPH